MLDQKVFTIEDRCINIVYLFKSSNNLIQWNGNKNICCLQTTREKLRDHVTSGLRNRWIHVSREGGKRRRLKYPVIIAIT